MIDTKKPPQVSVRVCGRRLDGTIMREPWTLPFIAAKDCMDYVEAWGVGAEIWIESSDYVAAQDQQPARVRWKFWSWMTQWAREVLR